MARVVVAVASAFIMSACANAVDAPSYLGMSTGSIEGAAPAAKPAVTPNAIRHVSSNRVLGAMAFQKVTGAGVDPSTLAGSNQP